MTIRPATKKSPAVIELTQEEEKRVEQISPDTFIGVNKFPSGIRLIISENEALSDEARDSVRGGILTTP